MTAAGASIVFVGIADRWKPFPGEAALSEATGVEIVPLDITDSQSVADAAAGHRVVPGGLHVVRAVDLALALAGAAHHRLDDARVADGRLAAISQLTTSS